MTAPQATTDPLQDPKYQFSPEEVDAVYDELGKLVIALDQDPLAFGPKRLNSKVALVRRAQDRCTRIFLDISHRLQVAQRALRIAETDYDLAKKALFANDPETRSGRNIADREAIAAGKLRKEVALMNHLKVLSGDLEAVLVVVKTKAADLRGVEGRLKDQLRLCQEEIGLGQRWGSKIPAGSDVDIDHGKAVADPDHIDDLVGRMDGEIHVAKATGSWTGEGSEDTLSESALNTKPTIIEPGYKVSLSGRFAPGDHGGIPKAKNDASQPVPEVKQVEPSISSTPNTVPAKEPVMIREISVGLISGVPTVIPSGSATMNDVDTYLDAMPMEGMAKKETVGEHHVALDDAELNGLLEGFESIQ